MTLDGNRQIERVWNITVGKNPLLASGLRLDGEIVPGNGDMYLFAVHGLGRMGLLSVLPSAYSGRIAGDNRFLLGHVKKIEITPSGCTVRAEFDGDPAGLGPFRIEAVPRALRLIGAAS
jgi:diacylglycerol kinase family enzyme